MTLLELLTIASATWYIAYSVVNTSGPFGVFQWIRTRLPLGGLTTCIICLSVWVALALRLIGANVVTDALAIAGVALFLHSYSGWRHNI